MPDRIHYAFLKRDGAHFQLNQEPVNGSENEKPETPEETGLSESTETIFTEPTIRHQSRFEHTRKLLSELEKEKEDSPKDGSSDGKVDASGEGEGGRPRVLVAGGDLPREIPTRLGRYLIDGVIGRGGMGVVYKARQEGLNRTVALKLLLQGEHASEAGRYRFEREAKAIAKLRHPNIVNVHEVGEYNGQPFFTMDYIDGLTLSKFVNKVKFESSAVVADLCARIADAVHYAHQQRVIHRDLKPDNILIEASGEPIITDFGLAKDIGDMTMFSMTGEIMGTPAFMSPEQASGKVSELDERTDIYSMGAILYWLLSKREPFHGKTMIETLTSVVNEDPPLITAINPSVEPELCAVCLKAMEKDVANRYQTAEEMADDLRRFLDGYPVMARPWTWRRALARYAIRHKRSLVAAAAAAILIALAGVLSATFFSRTYLDIARAQLTSENPDVRAQVVTSLGIEVIQLVEMKPNEKSEALVLLMAMRDDKDKRVLTAWLNFLIDYGNRPDIRKIVDPITAQRLMEMADNNDTPALRNMAITAIGVIRRSDFVDYLLRRVKEPNPSLRLKIVRSLGRQRTRRAAGTLINLTVSDPICRAEAQAALDQLYEKGRIAVLDTHNRAAKSALRMLGSAVAQHNAHLEVLLADSPYAVKPKPTHAYAKYEEELRSTDPETRLMAVYELGMTGDKQAASLILEALHDEDSAVGAAAAMALAKTDREGHVTTLQDHLVSSSPVLRGNAALALGFVQHREAVDPLLVSLTTEKNLQTKRRIIQALGELGSIEAMPGLQHAAETDSRVMPDVKAALARLQ